MRAWRKIGKIRTKAVVQARLFQKRELRHCFRHVLKARAHLNCALVCFRYDARILSIMKLM